MGSSSRNLWFKKKELKWPDIIFTTERAVYVMRDGRITPILENQEDDKCYYGISWSNNDLYISGKRCVYKFYRSIKDRYRRETVATMRKIFVQSPLVFALTSAGTHEYTIGLDLNRESGTYPDDSLTAESEECVVSTDGKCLVLRWKKKSKDKKEINMKEIISEVRSLERGFSHNGEAFPIRDV